MFDLSHLPQATDGIADIGNVDSGDLNRVDISPAAAGNFLARSDGLSGSALDSDGWLLVSSWSSCSMLSCTSAVIPISGTLALSSVILSAEANREWRRDSLSVSDPVCSVLRSQQPGIADAR